MENILSHNLVVRSREKQATQISDDEPYWKDALYPWSAKRGKSLRVIYRSVLSCLQ